MEENMNISTETAIEILTHPNDISIKISRAEDGKFFPKVWINEDGRVLIAARWASHETRESVINLIKKTLEACLSFKTALNCSSSTRESFDLCEKMLDQNQVNSIIGQLEKFDCVDTSSL
jgi:hypothetical protein